MTLQELVEMSYKTAKEKGFHDPPLSYGEALMLVVSELGEMLEAHRKGLKIEDNDHPTGLLPEIEELADVLIRLGDFIAVRYTWEDVANAIRIKNEYNKTRPHRHGKKF